MAQMNSVANVDLVSMFACVDYTGISLLIAASIMTTAYTAFCCEPFSRWFWMILTAVLRASAVSSACHGTAFNGQDMAWAQAAFFVGLGATGFIPIVQVFARPWCRVRLGILFPDCQVTAGLSLRSFRLRQQGSGRWFPSMFGYFGGSTTLWHIAVLGGILFHYLAMQEFSPMPSSELRAAPRTEVKPNDDLS